MIQNSHSNSNQAYLISDLFHLYKGKLQQIDSIFTLTTQGLCNSFAEKLTWESLKHGLSAYPPFMLKITLTSKSENTDDENCAKETPVRSRVFSKTYRWNTHKQRYEINAKGFEALEKFNEQNL